MLPKEEMIGSEEKTYTDSKCGMLLPDLSTICSHEDINRVKPGKIIIKGNAVSGIERLETSQWKTCMEEASRIQKPGKHYEDKEVKIRALEEEGPKLVPDLIRLVLERLNFVAFLKARSISSDWYSTAELCIRKTPTPWLILFPSNHLDSKAKLFDPQENKTYTVNDVGFDFARSRCLANSGSWFLMLDHRTDFHLLNLFTRQRIRLPSIEAIHGGQLRLKRINDYDFTVTTLGSKARIRFSSGISNIMGIHNAVLWVDERSRDYLLVWSLDSFFAYHRKEGYVNNSWKVFEPLEHRGCVDNMVFKESKLYVLSGSRHITVYDFSGGGSPLECASFSAPDCYLAEYFHNLAVTLSGQVLIISRMGRDFLNFYKMDPESSKWSILKCLGEEALILDQGITVAAKDGVLKNCIYYSNDQHHRLCNDTHHCYTLCNDICVSNIRTKKVVQEFQHLTAFNGARWFFPTFGAKWSL